MSLTLRFTHDDLSAMFKSRISEIRESIAQDREGANLASSDEKEYADASHERFAMVAGHEITRLVTIHKAIVPADSHDITIDEFNAIFGGSQ